MCVSVSVSDCVSFTVETGRYVVKKQVFPASSWIFSIIIKLASLLKIWPFIAK